MITSDFKSLKQMQDDKHPRAGNSLADAISIKFDEKLLKIDKVLLVTDNIDEAKAKAIEQVKEKVQEYLNGFVELENKCPCCDADLGGWFGHFRYSIFHGEGNCGRCGYPCRANHYVEVPYMTEKVVFEMVLPYHPDDLSEEDDNA